jgi:hypothetical protein
MNLFLVRKKISRNKITQSKRRRRDQKPFLKECRKQPYIKIICAFSTCILLKMRNIYCNFELAEVKLSLKMYRIKHFYLAGKQGIWQQWPAWRTQQWPTRTGPTTILYYLPAYSLTFKANSAQNWLRHKIFYHFENVPQDCRLNRTRESKF